jgi:hypothetical protein
LPFKNKYLRFKTVYHRKFRAKKYQKQYKQLRRMFIHQIKKQRILLHSPLLQRQVYSFFQRDILAGLGANNQEEIIDFYTRFCNAVVFLPYLKNKPWKRYCATFRSKNAYNGVFLRQRKRFVFLKIFSKKILRYLRKSFRIFTKQYALVENIKQQYHSKINKFVYKNPLAEVPLSLSKPYQILAITQAKLLRKRFLLVKRYTHIQYKLLFELSIKAGVYPFKSQGMSRLEKQEWRKQILARFFFKLLQRRVKMYKVSYFKRTLVDRLARVGFY